MSTLLQARDVTHGVGERTLFSDLEFTVSVGSRVGLVGHNGCGKSTLLDFLSNARTADAGEIIYRRGLKVGRVEQFLPEKTARRSVVEAVLDGLPERSDERWRAEALLGELGIASAAFDLRAGELSGGQQNRLMFARAVIAEPDLLLLDEPTNHLDLATMRVFESFLSAYRGAFVLVSHDRAFLDAVATTTWFLRDGRLWCFDLPFSEARAALAEADDAARRSREAEERKIEAVRASAKRLAIWGRDFDNEKFARRAKSMEKRAERMEAEKTFVTEGSPLDLTLDLAAVRSKEVVRVENAPRCADRRAGASAVRHRSVSDQTGRTRGAARRQRRRQVDLHPAADRRISGRPRQREYGSARRSGSVTTTRNSTRRSRSPSLVDFIIKRVDVADAQVRRRLINAGFPYRDHDKRLVGDERR